MARCCEELRVSNFYVSLLVEGLGVAFLVFIGGTVLLRVDVSKSSYIVEASMVLGFTLAVLSQCLKDVSGSHMNPAITIACMLTRRVSLLRAFMYIMFQCGGGILGALALKEMTPASKRGNLAMTVLAEDISIVKGIGYEMIFSFIYAWVYFASKTARDTFKGFGGPLAIGLTYAISHIVILPFTGCSLNPARSLGPAVMKEEFEDQWIYAAGPILSASLAGLLHDFIFAKARRRPRPRSCSLTCCKPSREEAAQAKYVDEDYAHRHTIIERPTDSGV